MRRETEPLPSAGRLILVEALDLGRAPAALDAALGRR